MGMRSSSFEEVTVLAEAEMTAGTAGTTGGGASGHGSEVSGTLLRRTLDAVPVRPADWFDPRARWRARHAILGSEGARRYLAPNLELPDFFRILKQRGISYSVLRWFESLPQVDPGEDVDILIADEHLEFVHSLLLARPMRRDSQPFDVYTVSGLPGSDYCEVPYYPPQFAQAVLADAVLVNDLYRAPSPEHHFLSLAYHAVYHKGLTSGLRASAASDDVRFASDHDYEAVLTGLAKQLDLSVDPTLDGLDRLLSLRGLQPPLDTLERLRPGNPWIHTRFFADRPSLDPKWRGLAVFVVRERAGDQIDLIASELNRHGFEVLETVQLDETQRTIAGRRIRGGNWAQGPWPVSGGGPVTFVIVYDVAPWLGKGDGGGETNLRIAEAKAKVRDRLLRDVDEGHKYNPLHSSDNPRQSLDYLDILDDPPLVARVGDAAAKLAEMCAFPFPVVRFLAPNAPARRARVALVDHPVHGHCVCKVYRPGAIRFFERELRARTELSDLPEVPALLDKGDNWLISPFYKDDGNQILRSMPFMDAFRNEVQLKPEVTRALARFAKDLHERGLFVLDLTTENLFSDPVAGLKIIDLEFLQEYQGPVPALSASYTFRGIPSRFAPLYDEPQEVPLTDTVGNQVFHPAVCGLPCRALLRPQRPHDEMRRKVTQRAWYLYFALSRPPFKVRGLLSRSKWGRRAVKLVKLAVNGVRRDR
jgi:hypothetical protein